MIGAPGAEAFALTYGELERTIADLNATEPEAIRVRFRKLRLRPFPSDIRTGTGVRVRYDLARSIALATVFELNSLWLPQGAAVSIVERAWPEICRAAVCAASDLGLAKRPPAAPPTAGAVVTFVPDGFASGAVSEVVAAWSGASATPGVSGIRLDMARPVAALLAATDAGDPVAAFTALEARFGWTRPHDVAPPDGKPGGFLENGPYLERAEALIGAADAFEAATDARSRIRMQALVDYLADPAPIDAWKANLGRHADEPRLGHLLMSFARLHGLDAPGFEVVEAVIGPEDLGVLAAHLIRGARIRSF